MKRTPPLIGLALILLVGGCAPPASEAPQAPITPPSVAFLGKVDPKFVGVWKTAKETSRLDLRKDGSVTIFSAHPSPGGIVKSTLEGKWLVSGGDLLFRYTVPHQTETIVKYPAKLNDKQMVLDQGSRSTMTYVKS